MGRFGRIKVASRCSARTAAHATLSCDGGEPWAVDRALADRGGRRPGCSGALGLLWD